jgi:hypothetical protein
MDASLRIALSGVSKASAFDPIVACRKGPQSADSIEKSVFPEHFRMAYDNAFSALST